jgi:hypothetical protein
MPRGGKREGAGRPKGTPNKVTQDMRELVRQSLDAVGGIEWLQKLASEEPRAYAQLVAKIIPAEVKATIDASPEMLASLEAGRKRAADRAKPES